MLAMIPKPRPNWIPIVTSFIFLMGCSSAYYGTMEKLGYPKRDLMVSRVESARDAQQEAKVTNPVDQEGLQAGDNR